MLGIRTAAAIEPHWKRSPRIRSVGTPAESVRWSELEMNVVTYTNSLTQSENVKITTVRIPGREIGKTMRRSAAKREQPSISAASSSSGGIVLKKPIISHVENGTVKDGYTRISE